MSEYSGSFTIKTQKVPVPPKNLYRIRYTSKNSFILLKVDIKDQIMTRNRIKPLSTMSRSSSASSSAPSSNKVDNPIEIDDDDDIDNECS